MFKTWMKAGMGLALLCTSGFAQDVSPKQCDPTEIQQLESEAREQAVAEGCTDVSQCATAPVGVKACGGPRGYVVYCSASTDEKRLQRALDRLARREERYNQQCGIISTCELITPPQVELVNGTCQAVTPSTDTLP